MFLSKERERGLSGKNINNMERLEITAESLCLMGIKELLLLELF